MLLGIKEYEGESSSAESLDSLLCVAMISYELASDQISVSQQDSRTVHRGRESLRKKHSPEVRGSIGTPGGHA